MYLPAQTHLHLASALSSDAGGDLKKHIYTKQYNLLSSKTELQFLICLAAIVYLESTNFLLVLNQPTLYPFVMTSLESTLVLNLSCCNFVPWVCKFYVDTVLNYSIPFVTASLDFNYPVEVHKLAYCAYCAGDLGWVTSNIRNQMESMIGKCSSICTNSFPTIIQTYHFIWSDSLAVH